jgi:hypothetical protein
MSLKGNKIRKNFLEKKGLFIQSTWCVMTKKLLAGRKVIVLKY